MEKSNVETLFEWMDKTTNDIMQHENEPYLDSLAITLESLFYQNVEDSMDDILTHKIQQALKEIDISGYRPDEIRKAIQFSVLKGMNNTTQQQHMITPESVALIVGYLAEKLTAGKEKVQLFDPASGTANLLTTVMGHLGDKVDAFASEIDPTLIKLGLISANLQKMEVEFFHQDSLRPFLIDPLDLIVSDLPVGYYPDDIRANEFELKADEGHSYAHHLFIEQSLNYTAEGGHLIFVIPNFLFDSDQSDKLNKYLHNVAHVVGVLQLPESAFKSEKNVKSILILQKKGENTTAPKQPLLVKLPSLKNTKAMEDILGQMNSWFASYKS
ncbi:site-specific DNA-methyltransferase (adenine-specific) [Oceanobacillus limi]|uniref:Site-specific DNA-methyltransferase (Adenine-specific) n=1 Tax=Oceanobacillus limi TaxID=930131 RepID=A0A1I0EIL6_9BACI|nr:class I SAM-dependent methyltransferase [Oceanobacillus limi]SET45241.1 site-specific DNA-methyltransferase (adenine-specific) [Oceanobacillus limi]